MTINTVCLCGSTRFLDDFSVANIELTKRGLSVFSISFAMPKKEGVSDKRGSTKPGAITSEAESPGLKEYLDLVHLNKILRSDAIFVVGDGYIGRSTAREILWGQMHRKPVVRQIECRSNWDVAANSLRNGAFLTEIFPIAARVLGLP